jgi:hypothetical protein
MACGRKARTACGQDGFASLKQDGLRQKTTAADAAGRPQQEGRSRRAFAGQNYS